MQIDGKRYYYEDDTMYFTFGTTHSSKYGLFIITDSALSIVNETNASVSYASPQYSHGALPTGSTESQRTFRWKCAAEGLTPSEYEEMMLWLTVGNKGFLKRDLDEYWGYDAIVDSISNSNVWWKENQTMIVEFEIVFKTFGDSCATAAYDTVAYRVSTTSGEEVSYSWERDQRSPYKKGSFYMPEIFIKEHQVYEEPRDTFMIVHTGNAHSHIEYYEMLNQGGATFFHNAKFVLELQTKAKALTDNGYNDTDCWKQKLYYEFERIPEDKALRFYSKYGFVTIDGKQMIEQALDPVNAMNEGMFELEGHAPIDVTEDYNNDKEIILKWNEVLLGFYRGRWTVMGDNYEWGAPNIIKKGSPKDKVYKVSVNYVRITSPIDSDARYLKVIKHNRGIQW